MVFSSGVCERRRCQRVLSALAGLCVGVAGVWADLAPEETALVVNAESWLSRSLANEYAILRGIPAANVIRLEGVPSHEGITVDEFREMILQPVLVALDRRRLAAHVSCVVYSADFPTWVDVSSDIAGRRLPDVVGTRASLTGLTYLYQGVLVRHLDYLDFNSNWYARRTLRSVTPGRPWSDESSAAYREVETFFGERQKRAASKALPAAELAAWEKAEWAKALATLEKVAGDHPENGTVIYNLACARAETGRLDEAMAALTAAAAAGFTDFRHMLKDDDLTDLRGRADFKALMVRLREWQPEMTPPRPFSAAVGWTPQGYAAPPYKGARYLLSTMLGVCSGRGNSYDEAAACLRRAQAADGSRPSGTVYFMLNEDVRSTCREWAVHGAAAMVRANGVAAEVQTGVLPPARQDVAGAFVGAAAFDWQASGSRLLPGAIAEHLTSFGGVFDEEAGQTPLTDFIRAGAAGACGAVCEPHAIQAKFPHAFLQGYYTSGLSLAESFYLSVTGPYQLLVVGDALCNPWARRPAVSLAGITPGQRVDGVVPIRVDAGAAASPVVEVDWFLDGQRVAVLPAKQPLEVDGGKFVPGWHTLTGLASLAEPTPARCRATTSFVARGDPADFALIEVSPAALPWGGMVTVTRKGPAERRLAVLWLSEEIAVLEPGETEVKIRTDQLALGRVELRAVLGDTAETAVSGIPVPVTIERPVAVGTLPAGQASAMPEGLALSVDGVVTYPARAAGDWLEKAGVRNGAAVTIEGWFEVPEASLGQFQFRGNLPLDAAVRIDDTAFTVPAGSGWQSFPVALAAGTHSLIVKTSGREHPRLDIRFGVRGTAVLDGKSFRHR